MNILITGAGGFIGRNIIEYLLLNDKSENLKITGTLNSNELSSNGRLEKYNSKVNFVHCDLTLKSQIDKLFKTKFDMLIHCAAVSTGANDIINRPYLHVTDNAVMGSMIFRKSFEEKVKRVIFISCSAIYRSSDNLLKEEDQNAYEINPRYFGGGWTKVFLEKQCEFYSKLGESEFIVIRHSNMYGPNDDFNDDRSHMVAANLKRVFLADEKKPIYVWGTGKTVRDLLYIDDLSSFINLLLKAKLKHKYNIFNLGAEKGISVKDVVKTIIDVSKKNVVMKFDKAKPDIDVNIFLDCSKAKRLGWEQKYSFEEGIKKTFEWINNNSEKLQ